MTAFLWTVVILMAVALLVEILAFVGMASVAMRSARLSEVSQQLKQKFEPTIQLAKEFPQSLQPSIETITREGRDIATLVAARSKYVRAVFVDISRRVERDRLRLAGGVKTIEGQQRRRGLYRDVVEPVRTASQVVRGVRLAIWILRRVA